MCSPKRTKRNCISYLIPKQLRLTFNVTVCLLSAERAAISASVFDDPIDFEGWNCGAITTCGVLGHICGGYNFKGEGSDIIKTFNLPAGAYSVELDFIKIDSWFVCKFSVLC